MTRAAAANAGAARRPGRPSTGARERILEAAIEVLKADGYAGLSLAKVAARAGEGKALVSYHFGSKQGLLAAAARELGRIINDDILAALAGRRTVEAIVRGALDGLWRVLERDARLARVYFDVNAVSMVEDGVRSVMREVKDGWRRELARLLREAEDGPGAARARQAAVFVLAGGEGLSLEWIERGDTPELRAAREMLVAASVSQLAA